MFRAARTAPIRLAAGLSTPDQSFIPVIAAPAAPISPSTTVASAAVSIAVLPVNEAIASQATVAVQAPIGILVSTAWRGWCIQSPCSALAIGSPPVFLRPP